MRAIGVSTRTACVTAPCETAGAWWNYSALHSVHDAVRVMHQCERWHKVCGAQRITHRAHHALVNEIRLPKANLRLGWMNIDINKRWIHLNRNKCDRGSSRINKATKCFLHSVRKRSVEHRAPVQSKPQRATRAATRSASPAGARARWR